MKFFAIAMAVIIVVLTACLSGLLVIATFKKIDEIKECNKAELKNER